MFHNYTAYRVWFSGLWHHVVWQAFTNVSKEPAIISGETVEHEAAGSFETLATPSTRHDIGAQELHGRVHLKSQTVYFIFGRASDLCVYITNYLHFFTVFLTL